MDSNPGKQMSSKNQECVAAGNIKQEGMAEKEEACKQDKCMSVLAVHSWPWNSTDGCVPQEQRKK